MELLSRSCADSIAYYCNLPLHYYKVFQLVFLLPFLLPFCKDKSQNNCYNISHVQWWFPTLCQLNLSFPLFLSPLTPLVRVYTRGHQMFCSNCLCFTPLRWPLAEPWSEWAQQVSTADWGDGDSLMLPLPSVPAEHWVVCVFAWAHGEAQITTRQYQSCLYDSSLLKACAEMIMH